MALLVMFECLGLRKMISNICGWCGEKYKIWVSSQVEAKSCCSSQSSKLYQNQHKITKHHRLNEGIFSMIPLPSRPPSKFPGLTKRGLQPAGSVCSKRWGNPTRIPSVNPAEELVPRYKYSIYNIAMLSSVCTLHFPRISSRSSSSSNRRRYH